ncbi:transmembrane proteins 14C-domain-containing protein, partial [Coniochaeta sp. 2T2.1]
PAFILSALTATGGIIGYARTGSLPSVIAGVSVGALYALGGYRIQNNQQYGIELALLASVVLGGSSIPRAIRLQKPVPVALSVVAL